MSISLHRDIYDLNDPGIVRKDLAPMPDPIAHIRYSCLFWFDHLRFREELSDHGKLHAFMQRHFLHWLEALSHLSKTAYGIKIFRKLQQKVSARTSPRLAEFLKDAVQFTLSYGSIVDQAPLPVHGAALGFSARNSVVRKLYWSSRLPFIQNITGIQEDWNAYLQTLEGHKSSINAVSFSPDAHTLASASSDCTVRIWDKKTGFLIQTLKSREPQEAFSWSGNSQSLVSLSPDGGVLLWNRTTRAQREIFRKECHATAISYSPVCHTLALGLSNGAVQLLDINKQVFEPCRFMTSPDIGSFVHPIQIRDALPSDSVLHLSLSSDGCKLVSGSKSGKVHIWNDETKTWRTFLDAPSLGAITFSPDGRFPAIGTTFRGIQLFGINGGTILTILNVYKGGPLCFWPDGQCQCVVSEDHGSLAFWSTATGNKQEYLKGYGSSDDFSIASDGHVAMVTGSTSIVLMDIRHRGSIQDESIPVTKQKKHVLEQFLTNVRRVAVNHAMGKAGSALSSLSASSLPKKNPRRLHGVPQQLKGQLQNDSVSICSSPDRKIAATNMKTDCTVRLYSAYTGEQKTTLDARGIISHICFSWDGQFLVTRTFDSMTRAWDTITGDCKLEIQIISNVFSLEFSPNVFGLDFSPDDSTLALPLINGKVGIWNLSDWKCKQYLKENGDRPINGNIAFSSDSQLLGVHTDRTVHLWKRISGTHKFASEFVLDGIGLFGDSSFAISPDNKLLTIYHTSTQGIETWEIATKTCICAFDSIPRESFIISPDSHTIAFSVGYSVKLFGLETRMWKQVFEDRAKPRLLSYSPDDRYIQTDRGALVVKHGPSYAFDSKAEQKLSLYVGHDWIFNNGTKFLWISPEYRSKSVSIRGSKDVLLHWDDRLVLITMDST